MEQRHLSRKQRNLDLDARFGRRLAAIRESRGISQEHVAETMRFCRPLVSKIEHGQRALSAVEIPDYARALSVAPEILYSELSHVIFEYDSSPLARQKDGAASTGTAISS